MASRRQLPCRICDLGRLRTFGVVATSLTDLTNKGMEKLCLDKLGTKQTYTVVLEDDGTIIDDEDYFMHLPENTKFMILGSSEEWTPEIKFSSVVKTDCIDGVESVICVDYPESSHNWKILARQLRKNLALIITMSESDLQELIDVPTAELAEELEETLKGTEAIQDSLQRALDNREEQRQAKGLIKLYRNACGKDESEDAEETDQVDAPDATTSQTSQLSHNIVNTLRQKPSPELSLSNVELQQSEMERVSTVVMMKRAQNFTDDDISTLLNEVETKRKRIIGTETTKAPRKGQMIAWSEVAEAVSANSTIARTAEQCRKKFNDLMRSAKSKMIHNAREPALAAGGVATLRELSEQEERVTQLLGFSSGTFVPGSQSDIGVRKGGQLPSLTRDEQCVEPAAAQGIGEGVTEAVGAVSEVKEEEIVKCLLVDGEGMDPGWLDTTSPSPGPSGSVPDTDDCCSTARNQPDTAEQAGEAAGEAAGDAAKRLTQQTSIETQVQQVEGLRQDMFTLHAKKRDSLASIRQGIDVVGKELTHVTMALNQMNETLVQLLQLQKAGSAAINLTPAGPPLPAPSADTVQAHEAAVPPIMMEANVAFQQQQQPLCYDPTAEGQAMVHRGLSLGRRGLRSRGRGKRRRQ